MTIAEIAALAASGPAGARLVRDAAYSAGMALEPREPLTIGTFIEAIERLRLIMAVWLIAHRATLAHRAIGEGA